MAVETAAQTVCLGVAGLACEGLTEETTRVLGNPVFR
jgi:hypothetical protein